MRTLKSLFVVILAISLYSCGGDDKPEDNPDDVVVADLPDSVASKIDTLKMYTEVSYNWIELVDSAKFAHIDRLLLEVSYVPSFDEARLNALRTQMKDIMSMSYDIEHIPAPAKIDTIDAMVDAYVRDVKKFAIETEGSEGYPLIAELCDTITMMNNEILINYRSEYQKNAIEFNQLIKSFEASLKKAGKEAKPFLLFTPYEPMDGFDEEEAEETTEEPAS